MAARETWPLEERPTVTALQRPVGNQQRRSADDERTEDGEPSEREL